MMIVKRNGTKVAYEPNKVAGAMKRCFIEVNKDLFDEEVAHLVYAVELRLFSDIDKEISEVKVEDIQNKVEEVLMDYDKEVAKSYILFRNRKDKERKFDKTKSYNFLSPEFLSKYKHELPPMTDVGMFTYIRTYSRYMSELGRREDWWETVARTVDYNIAMELEFREVHKLDVNHEELKAEAEALYDNVFNLRQFPSGRALWTSGNGVAKKYPASQYNCSGTSISKISDIGELCYLLMVGCGVGVGLYAEEVNKLPKFRKVDTVFEDNRRPQKSRLERTEVKYYEDEAIIEVGDSKEGWAEALTKYLELRSADFNRNIKKVIIDIGSVRPHGEAIKGFGGYASGGSAILKMIEKIGKALDAGKLRPINVLDMCTAVAEGVVAGGVRRSAIIAFIDPDDTECLKAKEELYKQSEDGKWEINLEIDHRRNANNTIIYNEKPSWEQLCEHIDKMRFSGEPGLGNGAEARRRFPDYKLGNPCNEILLDYKMFCNLTTINMMAFVKPNGSYDRARLIKAQELSARLAYRVTLPEIELQEWEEKKAKYRLTGCSLTGLQDFINATSIGNEELEDLLSEMRASAHAANEKFAAELGLEKSYNITTIKPEGTLSLLPTVSSGVHYSHSPYYIRRIRISAHDPLCQLMEDLGYSIKPEVGQEIATADTKVIEFAVKAPNGKTKSMVSAIDQLEFYKLTMECYNDQNTSITIHVRDDEWEGVKEWVFSNWDSIVGLSFLPYDDSFYQLLPYEAIEEDEYNELLKTHKPMSVYKLAQYEEGRYKGVDIEDDCKNGNCGVR